MVRYSQDVEQSINKIAILDGELHIFMRPNTHYWWCGFHHKGVYIRASTKCEALEDAKDAAK